MYRPPPSSTNFLIFSLYCCFTQTSHVSLAHNKAHFQSESGKVSHAQPGAKCWIRRSLPRSGNIRENLLESSATLRRITVAMPPDGTTNVPGGAAGWHQHETFQRDLVNGNFNGVMALGQSSGLGQPPRFVNPKLILFIFFSTTSSPLILVIPVYRDMGRMVKRVLVCSPVAITKL